MINVSICVDDYRLLQGVNSVTDQFFVNRDEFVKQGIVIKCVYDWDNEYSAVPRRERANGSKTITRIKKHKVLSNNIVYETLALLKNRLKYGYMAYKKSKARFHEDILIFECFEFAYQYLKKNKNVRGPKVVFMIHSYDDPIAQILIERPHIRKTIIERQLRKGYEFVFNNSDYVITICEYAERAFCNQSKQIKAIYNSVSIPDIKTSPGEHEVVNFVMASHINKEIKGIDILIDAIKSIDQTIRERIMIHVFGNGEYYDEAVELTKDVKCIRFYGNVDKPYKRYDMMDVLILTSRIETLPMSVLEAMKVGLPIVATDVGAVKELVFDHKNGILTKPNSKSIASAIEEVVNNKSLIVEWGKCSKELYYSKFSSEIWASKFSEVFCSLEGSL